MKKLTGAPHKEDSRNPASAAMVANATAVGEYRMIESAEIRDFRAISHVNLSGLKRINLVVGDNGAGKTTLLEALFMATGSSAEIGSRLRLWRGLEVGATVPQNEIYDALFGSLFHNFDLTKGGSVSIKGTNWDTRSAKFFYDKDEQLQLPVALGQGQLVQTSYNPLVFEFTNTEGKTERSVAQITQQGISVYHVSARGSDSSFVSARQPFNQTETARWYSNLSKENREKQFIDSLKKQFPHIESMSIEVEMGVPSIFVKTKWLPRKIPSSLASDGMTKLITILLHIAHAERSATFIDELENGLHFSRHAKLWPQLRETATSFESQVFASTHSFEFIKAAVPTIEKYPNDFCLIRAYQHEGETRAAVVSGQEALSLIEAGLEIRG
jgi:predicted ATPase